MIFDKEYKKYLLDNTTIETKKRNRATQLSISEIMTILIYYHKSGYWFYGFKLHMVINNSGEILGFTFTPANISDVDTKSVLQITKDITGKLFGDKGYISKRHYSYYKD